MYILFIEAWLGIISKNTILKAIHNVSSFIFFLDALGIISKNTILKAIHNIEIASWQTYKVGNHK